MNDPITDAEVAGVPHCQSCGDPLVEDRTHHCPRPPEVVVVTEEPEAPPAADDDDAPVDDDGADLDIAEDDLPEAVASEVDEDGTAAETGAVLDDNEDPGVPLDDDPFGPEYVTVGPVM